MSAERRDQQLVAYGLIALIPVLSGLGLVLAVLAIAAGIFILLDR